MFVFLAVILYFAAAVCDNEFAARAKKARGFFCGAESGLKIKSRRSGGNGRRRKAGEGNERLSKGDAVFVSPSGQTGRQHIRDRHGARGRVGHGSVGYRGGDPQADRVSESAKGTAFFEKRNGRDACRTFGGRAVFARI